MAIARSLVLIVPLLARAACGDTPAAEALRGLRGAPAAEAPEPEGPWLELLAPRRAVLLPASGTGQRRLWRGEGGLAIATEGARVVGTAGFPQMVMGTRFEAADPLEDARGLVRRDARTRRTVDLAGSDREPSGMRFGLVLDCTLHGTEQGDWILVEERCPLSSGTAVSRFWADAETGTVWRSEQWAGDGVTLSIRLHGP